MENVKKISITLLGRGLRSETESELAKQFEVTKYRDAFCIVLDSAEAWLFDYGVMVAWGTTDIQRQQLLEVVNASIDEPITPLPSEQYNWSLQTGTALSIHHDHLLLHNNEPLTRLALSHAFAQSAKLIALEERAQEVMANNAYISRELAKTGKVPLNRRSLAKLRGELFQTSTDISLHYGLLDVPEFFWDYPELEESYLKLAKYLDLQPRIEILNKKLETIQSLLDMLAAEQYSKHSAFLEWIIIILIAVDIMIYFF
jgi:uncharacterized Rmd1/YagE family protein